MSISKEELIEFLQELEPGQEVAIDDGGLRLVAVPYTEDKGPEEYYEIGGWTPPWEEE